VTVPRWVTPRYRAAIIRRISTGLAARGDEIAATITAEHGLRRSLSAAGGSRPRDVETSAGSADCWRLLLR